MKPMELFGLKETIEQLKEMFKVEKVYGEPIQVNGRTIIPVVRIGCGGGGGGGIGEGPAVPPGSNTPKKDESLESTAPATGEGMGFGFGGGATPVGFLVVENEKTRWVPIINAERIAMKILQIGAMVVKLRGRFLKKAGKK